MGRSVNAQRKRAEKLARKKLEQSAVDTALLLSKTPLAAIARESIEDEERAKMRGAVRRAVRSAAQEERLVRALCIMGVFEPTTAPGMSVDEARHLVESGCCELVGDMPDNVRIMPAYDQTWEEARAAGRAIAMAQRKLTTSTIGKYVDLLKGLNG